MHRSTIDRDDQIARAQSRGFGGRIREDLEDFQSPGTRIDPQAHSDLRCHSDRIGTLRLHPDPFLLLVERQHEVAQHVPARQALVADQETTTRQIIEFCDLTWDDACLRFHEGDRTVRTFSFDQVSRPLYASSIDRAAGFGSVLDPLRSALAQTRP